MTLWCVRSPAAAGGGCWCCDRCRVVLLFRVAVAVPCEFSFCDFIPLWWWWWWCCFFFVSVLGADGVVASPSVAGATCLHSLGLRLRCPCDVLCVSHECFLLRQFIHGRSGIQIPPFFFLVSHLLVVHVRGGCGCERNYALVSVCCKMVHFSVWGLTALLPPVVRFEDPSESMNSYVSAQCVCSAQYSCMLHPPHALTPPHIHR